MLLVVTLGTDTVGETSYVFVVACPSFVFAFAGLVVAVGAVGVETAFHTDVSSEVLRILMI